METSLRPQDLGFGRLFDHIRDAVIVVNAQTGGIILWNPAAAAIFGYSAEEARALAVEALVPERLRPAHRAGLARYGATGHGRYIDAPAVLELPALHRDGREFPVELTLSPLEGASTPHRLALAIVRDVTARARVEAERAALLATEQERLRRLGELAVLRDDFVAMVAHELSSPLAAIRNYAALLERRPLAAEEQARVGAAIGAEARALAALVADVRALRRAERDEFAVRPAAVPVEVLLADGVAFARGLPGEHPVEVVVDPAAAHRRVRADPVRVGQVLRNLLGNAAKYSAPAAPIELRALARDGWVRFQVADRGSGIHPHDLGRIFEKFARGREWAGGAVPGVGLGLYLSRRIVRAHGADLTVESHPGVGSVFGFDLEVAP
jgi:PAS domain S-box-containing protein